MRPIEAIPANKQAIAVDDWKGKTERESTMYLSLVQLLQRLPGAAGDCQVSALLLHEWHLTAAVALRHQDAAQVDRDITRFETANFN